MQLGGLQWIYTASVSKPTPDTAIKKKNFSVSYTIKQRWIFIHSRLSF